MQVPAPFDYARASSVDDAIALLERLGPEARLVAGGHSLLPMMKLRLATPEHLIDINPLADELGYIREHDGEVRIGALTRHREILESDLLAERFPIVRDAERLIADPPVRNRGTIGGALCQADPSEDLSAVCAALGGVAVIRGSRRRARGRHDRVPPGPVRDRGRRRRDAGRGAHPGARARRQRLREGQAPHRRLGDRRRRRRALARRRRHRRRRHRAQRREPDERPLDARGGGARRRARRPRRRSPRPPRSPPRTASPIGDQRGPADYKRHLAQELTHRALRRAAERALAS